MNRHKSQGKEPYKSKQELTHPEFGELNHFGRAVTKISVTQDQEIALREGSEQKRSKIEEKIKTGFAEYVAHEYPDGTHVFEYKYMSGFQDSHGLSAVVAYGEVYGPKE